MSGSTRPRRISDVCNWETAARIDEAVQHLATTKEGPLRRVLINGVVETRLLVPPYAAIVSLDRRARLVKVWAIVRYAP